MADVKTVKGTLVGAKVETSEENAERLGSSFALEKGSSVKTAEPTGFDAMKVDELKTEIESRNEGREEADLIPTDGKKADLIAALEADDSK